MARSIFVGLVVVLFVAEAATSWDAIAVNLATSHNGVVKINRPSDD